MPGRSAVSSKRKASSGVKSDRTKKVKVNTDINASTSANNTNNNTSTISDYVDIDNDQSNIIETLQQHVIALQTTVDTMRAQINFLLSALGWSSVPSPPKGATTVSAEDRADSDGSKNHASVDEVWSEVVRQPKKATKALRDTIVAAVYNDQRQQTSRAANLVVTGLPSVSDVDDKQLMIDIIRHEFNINPDITHHKRLGQQHGSKPRPLLITFRSADEADRVMERAKHLRQSSNVSVRSIYINRHMTSAQSKAAYDERCRRRELHQRKTTTTDGSTTSAIPLATVMQQPTLLPSTTSSGSLHGGSSTLRPSAADFVPVSVHSGTVTTNTTVMNAPLYNVAPAAAAVTPINNQTVITVTDPTGRPSQ